MATDIVIAGLSVRGFDALRAISERLVAPSGKLFATPVKLPGYPKEHAQKYQEMMRDHILALRETEPISLTLAYVDYNEETTAAFVNAFRPFALVRPIAPLGEDVEGKQACNRASSEYGKYLTAEAKELRARAKQISEFTHIRNVTPYLLPYGNFESSHYREMIERLYDQLGTANDIAELMKNESTRLAQHHPRVKPPGQQDSCFTDGRLYFRSPGRNRHGYFRHSAAKEHHASCLLAARSRLGGSYAHDLHYDCTPVKQLAANYANCHGVPTPPEKKHVNICPNDYVI